MAEAIEKRVEKIDHAFELLLVLSGIIAAALFEHSGIEIPELPPVLQSIPAAMNFLFLPFIILIPLWIYNLITDNRKIQMILRPYLWCLIIFHLFLMLTEFVLVSLLDFDFLFYFLFCFTLLIPILPGLFAWRIISAYGDGLLKVSFSRRLNILLFVISWVTIWIIMIVIISV